MEVREDCKSPLSAPMFFLKTSRLPSGSSGIEDAYHLAPECLKMRALSERPAELGIFKLKRQNMSAQFFITHLRHVSDE